MATTLSRGRTQITRKHTEVGHVVHEADDAAQFVHLNVLCGRSIDVDDDGFVAINAEEQPPAAHHDMELRVVVGEDPVAMYFRVDMRKLQETKLVRNIHVHPYDKIVVSVSRHARGTHRYIVNGFVTKEAVVD